MSIQAQRYIYSKRVLIATLSLIGLTVACQSKPQVKEDLTVLSAKITPTPTVIPTPRVSIIPTPTPTVIPTPTPTVIPTPRAIATPTPAIETDTESAPVPQTVPTQVAPPQVTPTATPSKIATANQRKIFQSQEFGLQFSYPQDYVVQESPGNPTQGIPKSLHVWTQNDYQAIKSNKFQSTDLPGNVSISMESNPQRLSLTQWVTNSEQFTDVQDSSAVEIANQNAITFRSGGLYDSTNVVLPSADGANVIVISLAEGDRDYQQVFRQIISSLKVN